MVAREYIFHDRRSLELFKLAVAKLRADPRLFDDVASNMEHWRRRVVGGGAREDHYFHEWERVLAGGIEACERLARDRCDSAVELWHTAPFEGLINEREGAADSEQVRALFAGRRFTDSLDEPLPELATS